MVEVSSGFSVEQLEQMNAAVMGAVWHGRGDWNRTRLAEKVKEVFNKTADDIQECQKIANGSQEDAVRQGQGVGLGVSGAAPEMVQAPQWR